LGYGDAGAVPDKLAPVFRHAVEEALREIKPLAVIRTAGIDSAAGGTISAGGLRVTSRKWSGLARRMESPQVLMAYALTLGAPLDEAIAAATERSLALAYAIDAAGSEAVEILADTVEAEAGTDLRLTRFNRTARFSPGYCDWQLEAQRYLMAYLDAGRIGIKMARAGGMQPSKTITAAVIFAKNIPSKTPCPRCAQRECTHRRIDIAKT
jgi:hypothetical protein